MAIRGPHRQQIEALLKRFLLLSARQKDLIAKITESELAEDVFNSNAIENSRLSLLETELIIFASQLSPGLDLREVLEARNLASVYKKVHQQSSPQLNQENILSAHKILIGGIRDEIAGRFRKEGENVRIGNHVAPVSEKIPGLMENLLAHYYSSQEYFLEKIAKFHLDFELIHPFCDGNGRMGRILLNWQLKEFQCPPVIIRNSDKKKYFSSFLEFKKRKKPDIFEKIITLALLESLHKRVTVLEQSKVISLADWVRKIRASPVGVYNAAKRQILPAFRQNEVWMIGESTKFKKR